MLRWDQYEFNKKRAGICYIKPVFLRPVGFVSCIVHSTASEVQNIDALFFIHGWDRYGFHKKRVGKHYAKLVFLHPVGSTGDVVRSSASGARNLDAKHYAKLYVRIPQKACQETLCQTIFHARVGLVRFPKIAR
jgi:hypothetical protein